jgi:hypothetical protein
MFGFSKEFLVGCMLFICGILYLDREKNEEQYLRSLILFDRTRERAKEISEQGHNDRALSMHAEAKYWDEVIDSRRPWFTRGDSY